MDLQEKFERWDRGELVYSDVEEKLKQLQPGQKLGSILENCTICSVNNGTCPDYFRIFIYGMDCTGVLKKEELWVCTLGVEDSDDCRLNK